MDPRENSSEWGRFGEKWNKELESARHGRLLISNKAKMDKLSEKELWATAKVKGLKGYGKMSKGELIDAISPNGIILTNLRVKELWAIAKERHHCLQKMSKTELVEFISTNVSLSEKNLREIAKVQRIEGYRKMRKSELIDAISHTGINITRQSEETLKQLAKGRGIKGYETMRKDKLTDAISSYYDLGFTEETVREIAKTKRIEGWERMSKGELLEIFSSNDIIINDLSVETLREIARVKCLKGYSKMSRDVLINTLTKHLRVSIPYEM